MSFRCAITGKHVTGKPRRVILKTRRVVYPPKYDSDGEVVQNGGEGREIAREVMVDPALTQEQIESFIHR